MATKVLDCMGMKCPRPTLTMLSACRGMQAGDIIEVVADCPTFEADVRKFCDQQKKALLFVKVEGSAKRVQVRI